MRLQRRSCGPGPTRTTLQWFYHPDRPIPSEPIASTCASVACGVSAWSSTRARHTSRAASTAIVPDEKLVFAWGANGPELDPDRLDDSPQVSVLLRRVGARTEMIVTVELPASLSQERVQEWWSVGIRDGWRETVDRLVVALARTPTAI
jgi:hypothetical protein